MISLTKIVKKIGGGNREVAVFKMYNRVYVEGLGFASHRMPEKESSLEIIYLK